MDTNITRGAPATTAPTRRPRRRWWKLALGLIVPLILAAVGWWVWSRAAMNRAWNEAVAEAEQDLPRWRLLESEEDRQQVPDAENAALYLIALNKRRAGGQVSSATNYNRFFDKLQPTPQLNAQQIELIRAQLAKIPNVAADARNLKDMPRGRFPIHYPDDYITTRIEEQQLVRGVADILAHDAYLLAQENRMDEAIESCRAILCASGSLRDDPFLICLLIRVALDQIAIQAIERVMAQGEASEKTLAALQAALERESRVEQWLHALRFERAGQHHLFENVRAGKVSLSGLSGGRVTGSRSFEDWFVDAFPMILLKYYPDHLKYMNRMVETAKLPTHERGAKHAEMEAELRADLPRKKNLLTALLLPALTKVHNADVRNHATLRCAVVAVACERYRLTHKEWPASLDVLVREKLIDVIPTDPMDNQPLRFRRTKDGLVVYSIGVDKTDNQGHIDRERPYESGVDFGFRLWDVPFRRQPAPPPIGTPEVERPK